MNKKILDPFVINRIKNFDLRARLVVEGFLSGLHLSPFKGYSIEFSEHTAYNPGDPIELIDWKVYARTERYYLKKFQEDTNMRVYLLLDISNSMAFGSPFSKLDYAKTLVASLSYLFLRQNDAVSLTLFNERMVDYLPPLSKTEHFKRIISHIENVKAYGRTNLSNSLYKLATIVKKRGLIVIISDLFQNVDTYIKPLKGLRISKNEVIVFQILDRNEVEFNLKRGTHLRDMETGITIPVDPVGIKRMYKQAFNKFLKEVRDKLLNGAIEYSLIRTDTDYGDALLEFLSKRKGP